MLVATACANPPEGRARWTLELLADAMVRLTGHGACRARRCAGGWPKTVSSPGAGTCGAFQRSTANTSPAWKTCSTSMPKRLTPSRRWSASTRAESNSSARCASRSWPRRASRTLRLRGTAATAPSTSSLCSTRIVPGVRSKSPSGERQEITPSACANSPTSIIPTPRASGSCRTTCQPTRPAPL